ncbi:S-adenosyl-L-methionine-dependent methyltransferase [Neohortaea acidophila]|uniref:S-adenosyl-L-methionine-dependent methyltransferase n=1 Tax=Neohortaea acidophila TaxID=245834 RepID=A0A6A6PF68_9PEZI|nr:S-adenosyl-L-methionine-dependent methyltransferase [Neohortaea acidophila]KAF2478629.1 S-adenosyl-L-methionine-dependent methyltransferase [Neohortaea acidophila]
MPRIHPGLIRRTHATSPLVARLLPICRDLRSSYRELTWLRDHAQHICRNAPLQNANRLLQSYVLRRSRGEPLQYILGTEYFGPLEIQCRPGVLIPRQETAASVTHLVNLLSSAGKTLPPRLRVLDLCTGTGCIPLLFQHEYYFRHKGQNDSFPRLDVVGVDNSSVALRLAEKNKRLQLAALRWSSSSTSTKHQSLKAMTFMYADVLRGEETLQLGTFDILISNPPYISSTDYWRNTSPSVRKFEPHEALVPPANANGSLNDAHDGDLFYHHLHDIALRVNAQIVLLEVADLEQAHRVSRALNGPWDGVEIWRDEPAARDENENTVCSSHLGSASIPILGLGNGRSVFAYRGRGAAWLGK